MSIDRFTYECADSGNILFLTGQTRKMKNEWTKTKLDKWVEQVDSQPNFKFWEKKVFMGRPDPV